MVVELKKQIDSAGETNLTAGDKADKEAAKADSDRLKAEHEFSAKITERVAASALEADPLKDINTRLDDRILRERAISAEVEQQIRSEGDVKKTKNTEDTNNDKKLSPNENSQDKYFQHTDGR